MKRTVYLFVFALIACLAVLLVVRISGQQHPFSNAPQPKAVSSNLPDPEPERKPILSESEQTTVTAYFYAADQQTLVPISQTVSATEEPAAAGLLSLLAGPPDDALYSPLPQHVTLYDLYQIQNVIYVDLSQEILTIKAGDEEKAVAALAATVLSYADDCTLRIQAEGQTITQLGDLSLHDAITMPVLNADPLPEGLDAEECASVIYYTLEQKNSWLLPRTLYYPLPEEEDAERAQLSALATQLLPKALLLRDAWRSEGEVFLELSLSEDSAYLESAASEQKLLESLMRSVCRIRGVDSLTILFSGATTMPQGALINQPLSLTTFGPINPY